jgi:hypothetical protein
MHNIFNFRDTEVVGLQKKADDLIHYLNIN